MYFSDIENEAEKNTSYRKVLFSGLHSQVVLMSLKPGEEIGEEVHENDQTFFIVEGIAEIKVEQETKNVTEDQLVLVPAGKQHNVKNSGQEDLKLFTIYAPSHHPDGLEQPTKQ